MLRLLGGVNKAGTVVTSHEKAHVVRTARASHNGEERSSFDETRRCCTGRVASIGRSVNENAPRRPGAGQSGINDRSLTAVLSST